MYSDLTMIKINMAQSRSSYNHFVRLCNALNEFSLNIDSKTTRQLELMVKTIKVEMPLPSGRFGNSLAVALEMQCYEGALFMILHANELGIDLDEISCELGGRDVWNVEKTFELSQIGFETTKIEEKDESYKDYPWLRQSKNNNIAAALEIANLLQERNEEIIMVRTNDC